MKKNGFAAIGIVVILALIGVVFYIYSADVNSGKLVLTTPTPSSAGSEMPAFTPLPTKTPGNTQRPAFTATPTLAITASPSASPSPRPFEEEEMSMRKTIAGFEMYIGTSNTAGALTFFTPPESDSAKAKLAEIRSKNLPYRLTSWQMVTDSQDKYLATEQINQGYRVRVIECRTTNSCPSFYLELVRDETAENHFSIYRYYDTTYIYQNNLGEAIKYQGFSF